MPTPEQSPDSGSEQRRHRTDFGFELTEAEQAWLDRNVNDSPLPEGALENIATILRPAVEAARQRGDLPGRGGAPAD